MLYNVSILKLIYPSRTVNPICTPKSRAGIAEMLANLAGSDVIAALGQAASNAAFDRIVDIVTIQAVSTLRKFNLLLIGF
jgi:hypothetical protein